MLFKSLLIISTFFMPTLTAMSRSIQPNIDYPPYSEPLTTLEEQRNSVSFLTTFNPKSKNLIPLKSFLSRVHSTLSKMQVRYLSVDPKEELAAYETLHRFKLEHLELLEKEHNSRLWSATPQSNETHAPSITRTIVDAILRTPDTLKEFRKIIKHIQYVDTILLTPEALKEFEKIIKHIQYVDLSNYEFIQVLMENIEAIMSEDCVLSDISGHSNTSNGDDISSIGVMRELIELYRQHPY
ncbi:hypothetical protein [Candidatus Bodocaedibacter vickermanii]|uniref:Uncharacterized protein n=1 Tax=Candidatus Bodocaedibacter vickermanii TaxID=2741701 RepID=A0A7L9RUX3_9PROT|nr:hypothetical protein CPBP_01008 [Candidatus Paracaedibacteraceae bacterium 'Lake Konstanz']